MTARKPAVQFPCLCHRQRSTTIAFAAILLGLVCSLILGSATPAWAGPAYYTLIDLGGLDVIQAGSVEAINSVGQVVGASQVPGFGPTAFRTAPNSPINPLTDNLGSFGGGEGGAKDINPIGQVVGWGRSADGTIHAYRTAPNSPINPLTDDLGTLGGIRSNASGINSTARGRSRMYNLLGRQSGRRLTRLNFLTFTGTNVTDAGLEHLKVLTNLKILDLRSTNVTDAGLEHLKELSNLEVLRLEDTERL